MPLPQSQLLVQSFLSDMSSLYFLQNSLKQILIGSLFRRACVPAAPGHRAAQSTAKLHSVRGRALALLGLLLERRGELLSKDDECSVAPKAVEETNLNVEIANLRQIFDDGREQGSCIQTVHGCG
jgi:DNA-binding response OmpR family regulator